MHGPDKGNYPNECEFMTVDKPTLISWKHFSNPVFFVVVKFEAISGGKTKIDFKIIFNTAEECIKVQVFAVDKNEENFDRPETEPAKMQ